MLRIIFIYCVYIINTDMHGFKLFFDHSFADMAFYQSHGDGHDVFDLLGISTSGYDKIIESGKNFAINFINGINKVDKIIGIKKTILLNIPTYKAKIDFLKNVYKLSKHPKKPKYWKEMILSLEELSKLGLMNPFLAVPTMISLSHFAGISDQDALIAIMTKMTSSAYFYLENLTSIFKNSQNIKLKELAKKISILMPKSEIKH